MIFSRKSLVLAMTLAVSSVAFAQSWSEAYEAGLKSARAQKWVDARVAFRRAISIRPEDFSQATTLPGSVTDPQLWRNGSPYSPNFLAAYAGYKHAETLKDDAARTDLLTRVAEEFKILLAKSQKAPETVFFLNNTYGMLNKTDLQKDVFGQATKSAELTWRVDGEVVAPDEKASMTAFLAQAASNSTTATVTVEPTTQPTTQPATVTPPPTTPPKVDEPVKPINPTSDDMRPVKKPPVKKADPKTDPAFSGPPEKIPAKFALVIGNSASKLPGNVDFAASDAESVKNQLIQFGGYQEDNVRVLVNVSAVAILDAARKLAESVPEDGVVLIFFSGVAAHLDGKDYLAGVDTVKPTDAGTMLEKSALFRVFMQRSAKIFSFFQVNRPINRGNFFGKEAMMVGQISQMQATIPGGKVSSIMKGGKAVGLFTDAFGNALQSMRTNRVPILEFGWQVFEKIRAGSGTGSLAGGSAQVPTLPSYTNMSADSRF